MGVIAKYKFNNTLEANLLPEFNSEFTSDLYTVTDEVNGEVTTRTIESGSLPTLMRFGRVYVEGESTTDNRTDSLLEVLDMDTGGLTSCSNMFRYCKNLTSITCEWNTSNVTNMQHMFNNCKSLTTLDVSNFDTGNVTNMNAVFNGCYNLTSLDLSSFDTSKVTNMNAMFCNCTNLTSLDVSNFDTSNVTNMRDMFNSCNNLTTLDISNFDTSNATTMFGMFANMTKLTSLRCPNLATDSLTSIGRIFKGNTNLVTLDISNLTIDTSVVTDYTEIFLESPNIKYIKCNSTDTINLVASQLPTKTSDNPGTIICKSDITNLDTTTLQSINWNILDELTLIAKYIFDKSIHNNCIPEFNTEFEGYFIEDEVVEGNNEVTRTIGSCGMLPTLMRFGTNIILDINYKQGNEVALISIEYLNTENLTSCNMMFKQCSNLVIVNTEGWDTSKVTDMYSMFYRCYNLTSLDLSNFDTSNVTVMQYMFGRCDSLTTLDVSNFDTTNVTNMNAVFNGCKSLATLDISNWHTSNVLNMGAMFTYCNNLTSLDISNFDTSNATDMSSMFSNTPLLADIGVLYMDKSSLQKLVNAIPTDSNKTLWYKDVDIDGITHGNNITLKKYIEENVEIVLNSPLLEGDTIEVVDGKLCHVHRYKKIVFDGSEDWVINGGQDTEKTVRFSFSTTNGKLKTGGIQCDFFSTDATIPLTTNYELEGITKYRENGNLYLRIFKSRLSTPDENGLKQWLQQNPTTVVYELASPYYEDITPLQSSIALRTFEECNIQIITALPIKTKITYRTNITSAIVMEQELDTLDSGVSLSNLIEEEVDE